MIITVREDENRAILKRLPDKRIAQGTLRINALRIVTRCREAPRCHRPLGDTANGALWAYLIAIITLSLGLVALAWIFGPMLLTTSFPGSQSAGGSAAAPGAPTAPGAALHATIVTEGVKAILQLAVIGVIGGLAKFLFDRLQAVRVQREAGLEVQKEFLRRLHAAQAQVSRARETLRANQGAEAYSVQVQELMEARSALSALSEELLAADNAMLGRGRRVADELKPPLTYLDAVVQEWTQQHPVVQEMQEQNRDSQNIVKYLRDNCPELRGLRDAPREGDYRANFVGRIESAAKQLMLGILAETA